MSPKSLFPIEHRGTHYSVVMTGFLNGWEWRKCLSIELTWLDRTIIFAVAISDEMTQRSFTPR